MSYKKYYELLEEQKMLERYKEMYDDFLEKIESINKELKMQEYKIGEVKYKIIDTDEKIKLFRKYFPRWFISTDCVYEDKQKRIMVIRVNIRNIYGFTAETIHYTYNFKYLEYDGRVAWHVGNKLAIDAALSSFGIKHGDEFQNRKLIEIYESDVYDLYTDDNEEEYIEEY